MFDFFKDKNALYAPVDGTCVPITEVPDQMFADELLGKGVAFKYAGDVVVSPCSGRIVTIAETKHAVGIESDSGMEVLLHIGVDTVALAGSGFEVLVEENQKVQTGTPLIRIDRKFMEEKRVNLITPMVITNSADLKLTFENLGTEVTAAKTRVVIKK